MEVNQEKQINRENTQSEEVSGEIKLEKMNQVKQEEAVNQNNTQLDVEGETVKQEKMNQVNEEKQVNQKNTQKIQTQAQIITDKLARGEDLSKTETAILNKMKVKETMVARSNVVEKKKKTQRKKVVVALKQQFKKELKKLPIQRALEEVKQENLNEASPIDYIDMTRDQLQRSYVHTTLRTILIHTIILSIVEIEEFLELILPSGFKIRLPKEQVKFVPLYEEWYVSIFKRFLSEEQQSELTGKIVEPKNFLMQTDNKTMQCLTIDRTTDFDRFLDEKAQSIRFSRMRAAYSSRHTNYSPDKRFVLSLRRKYATYIPTRIGDIFTRMENFVHEYPLGLVQIVKWRDTNLYLIPKHMIELFTNGMRLTPESTTQFVTGYIRSSLKKQPHTKDQYIDLIKILSIVDLFITVVEKNVSEMLENYKMAVKKNIILCASLVKEDVSITPREIEETIMREPILLPYDRVLQHRNVEQFKELTYDLDTEDLQKVSAILTVPIVKQYGTMEEFRILNILTEDYDEKTDTFLLKEHDEELSKQTIIDMFRSGKFSMLWTKVRTLDLEVEHNFKLVLRRQLKTFKGTVDEVFLQGAARHYELNQHHVESWGGKKMDIISTIELLVDHWTCARRFNLEVDLALLSSLEWLKNPKFNPINTYGLLYFLGAISQCQLKTTQDIAIAKYSSKWQKCFTQEEVDAMKAFYDEGEALRYFQIHAKDFRIRMYKVELDLHMRTVDKKMLEIFYTKTRHDADKLEAGYALILLMKFGLQESGTITPTMQEGDEVPEDDAGDARPEKEEEFLDVKPESEFMNLIKDHPGIPDMDDLNFDDLGAAGPPGPEDEDEPRNRDLELASIPVEKVERMALNKIMSVVCYPGGDSLSLALLSAFVGKNINMDFAELYMKSPQTTWTQALEQWFEPKDVTRIVNGDATVSDLRPISVIFDLTIFINIRDNDYTLKIGNGEHFVEMIRDTDYYAAVPIKTPLSERERERIERVRIEHEENRRLNEKFNLPSTSAVGAALGGLRKSFVPAFGNPASGAIPKGNRNPPPKGPPPKVPPKPTAKSSPKVKVSSPPRGPLSDISDADFKDVEEQENLFIRGKDKLYEMLTKYAQTAKEGLAFVSKPGKLLQGAKKGIADWQEVMQSFEHARKQYFNFEKLPTRGKFAQIQDLMGEMINTKFNIILNSIWEKFGIPFENRITIPVSKIIFTYVVWVNTSSKMLKLYLIVDLLVQMGIFDTIWAVMEHTYGLVKEALFDLKVPHNCTCIFCEKEEITETISLAELTSQTKNEVKGMTIQKKEAEVSKEKQKEKPKEDIKEDESSIWSRLWHGVMNGIPTVLGAFATSILVVLGYSTWNAKNKSLAEIGLGVVQSSRNLHYLTMGLAAVPKIFTMAMGAVDWAIGKVSNMCGKKYDSKDNVERDVLEWLRKTAMIRPGFIEGAMAHTFSIALWVDQMYMEGLILERKITKCENHLQNTFFQKMRHLAEVYPKAKALQAIHSGIPEPMHVQMWGDPGIGKTDLALSTLKRVGKVFTDDPSIYPLNEFLTHADSYYGQKLLYIDDDNMFKNTPPEHVMQKLYLFSGGTLIANMASLSDKGRVFNAMLVVSNTNTPLPIPDGMYKPEALHRRRFLVKVVVDPGMEGEYKKLSVSDRANSVHLRFQICDPLTAIPMHDDLVNKEEMIAYLTAQAEYHQEREKTRSEVLGTAEKREAMNNYQRFITGLTTTKSFMNNKLLESQKKVYDELITLFDEENMEINKRIAEKLDITETTLVESHDWVNTKVIRSGGKYNFVSTDETVELSKPDPSFDRGGFKFFNGTVTYEGISTDTKSMLYWYEAIKTEHLRKRSVTALLQSWSTDKDRAIKSDQKLIEILEHRETWLQKIKSLTKSAMLKIWNVVSGVVLNSIIVCATLVTCMFILSQLGKLLNPIKPTMSYTGEGGKFKYTSSRVINHDAQFAQKSMFRIEIKDGVNTYSQNMFGIKGNIFMINKHSIKKLTKAYDVEIYDIRTKQTVTRYVDFSKYWSLDTDKRISDAVLIEIDNFRQVSDVHSKFVREADLGNNLQNFAYCKGLHVGIDKDKELKLQSGSIRAVDWEREKKSNIAVSELESTDVVRAEWLNCRGDSGSVLMHGNSKINNPFLGISMAIYTIGTEATGFSGHSYYTVVTQEQIDHALKQIPFEKKIETFHAAHMYKEEVNGKYEDVFDHIEQVGTFEPTQAVSTQCEFIKTPIHGVVPIETQPAILSPADKRLPEGARHPYKIALNKYCKQKMPRLSASEEKACIKLIKNTYLSVPGMDTARLVTPSEAIIGTRTPCSTAINLSSSPGLPYSLSLKKGGKKDYISYDEKTSSHKIEQVIFDDVADYIEHAERGIVKKNIKREFVKAELVSENKIYTDPKTRTVATGNVIHLIVYRMLFSDMYRLIKYAADGSYHCAIGVNPEADQWHGIAKHVLEANDPTNLDRIVELDVKSWESNMTQQLFRIVAEGKISALEKIYQARNETLPTWARKTAHALAVDFIDTDVVFEDVVFHKKQGMLSGHPGTLVENSDIHLCLMFVIYMRLLTEKGLSHMANIPEFKKHMGIVLAADDILFRISEKLSRHITPQEFVEGYNELNMSVTAADKSEVASYQNIEDVHFLKMGFTKNENGKYTMRPKTCIIYQLINWQRTNAGKEEQFETNLDTAFRFAYWLGISFYEDLTDKVNLALLRTNRVPYQFTYFDMHNRITRENLILQTKIKNNITNAVDKQLFTAKLSKMTISQQDI